MCLEGFYGIDCSFMDGCANNNPCQNGGECQNNDGAITCKYDPHCFNAARLVLFNDFFVAKFSKTTSVKNNIFLTAVPQHLKVLIVSLSRIFACFCLIGACSVKDMHHKEGHVLNSVGIMINSPSLANHCSILVGENNFN